MDLNNGLAPAWVPGGHGKAITGLQYRAQGGEDLLFSSSLDGRAAAWGQAANQAM